MDSTRILRATRAHPALFGEQGPAKEIQAARIIQKAKARTMGVPYVAAPPPPYGPFRPEPSRIPSLAMRGMLARLGGA